MSTGEAQRGRQDENVQRLPALLVASGQLRFRRLRADPDAFAITQAVVQMRHVTMRSLLGRARGCAKVAAARQLAMYLIHVLLGRPQDVVGRLFGRDASTVSHACRTIEDLRDNPPLETEIASIEHILPSAGAARHVA
jgi:chromosomal replication initiation ATPase DnaA